MIVLVDFENTHASGLEGYEYLNQNDTLVMYYSDENSSLTKGMVDDLKRNHVHVSLVKLLKQHSNALDMYIASTTGMYLDSGEKICIVSKDKGYAAVRDFWHSLRGAEILLGETIRECFLHSVVNDDERIALCKERSQKASLVDAFTTMNTVPTRPTLSRQNNSRRRRNNLINFTEITEPAPILPNPLAMEPVRPMAETAATPENDSRKNEEKMAGKSKRDRRPEYSRNEMREHSRRKDNPENPQDKTNPSNKISNHGGYDGLDRINDQSRKRNEEAKQTAERSAAPHEDTKPSTAIVPQTPASTSLVTVPAKDVKEDPNRMQFVWDPISRSMKKIGAAAEKTDENATGKKENDVAKKEPAQEPSVEKEAKGSVSETATAENTTAVENPSAETKEEQSSVPVDHSAKKSEESGAKKKTAGKRRTSAKRKTSSKKAASAITSDKKENLPEETKTTAEAALTADNKESDLPVVTATTAAETNPAEKEQKSADTEAPAVKKKRTTARKTKAVKKETVATTEEPEKKKRKTTRRSSSKKAADASKPSDKTENITAEEKNSKEN